MKILSFTSKLFRNNASKPKSLNFHDIRDDDVFIVSYPKSGNTWVRFLIGNYLTNGKMNFGNSHHIIPDMHFNPGDISGITLNPRFIKSHESFNKAFRNVIYVVRDGRDVAVSYFYYLKKAGSLPMATTFDQFFNERFITGKVGFGDWGEHVKSWIDAKNMKILFVKYEDLSLATESVLLAILDFLNTDNINQHQLQLAVTLSSFENMRRNEFENPKYFFNEGGLKDTGYGFMRKGEAGDWRNHFTTDNLCSFQNKYGKLMERLMYKPA